MDRLDQVLCLKLVNLVNLVISIFVVPSTYSPKGTLRKYVRTLPDILFPISEIFLQKG